MGAGIAPAAIDADGKEINPHIPQYMTKGLWYLNQDEGGTTLMHQRKWKLDDDEDKDEISRRFKVFHASKYREHACINCGSMTHDWKNCFERPRRLGAKLTGKSIVPDEKIQSAKTKYYDEKRDRWKGYDDDNYAGVVAKYYRIEKIESEPNDSFDININKKIEGIDVDKIGEEEQLNFDKLERRVNTVEGGSTGTVRNLRIREDTAKYLLNLDLNSAYYDPKSRSMRGDPTPTKPLTSNDYTGDNSIKFSGRKFKEFRELQNYLLTANQKGLKII